MSNIHEETLNVVITDSGYLAPLQRIGPISTPVKLSKSTIQRLLDNGCHVYDAKLGTCITKLLSMDNDVQDEPITSEPDPIQKEENTEEEAASVLVEEDESEKDASNKLSASDYVFDLNEDGTVNESNIPWSMFSSKGERKTLRARISAINKAATE